MALHQTRPHEDIKYSFQHIGYKPHQNPNQYYKSIHNRTIGGELLKFNHACV
jgi:hypothetical protein